MKRPLQSGSGRGDGDRPAKRGGGDGPRHLDLNCVLKFLAPEALCSACIGKGGHVISAMRQKTGARIAFTEHEELYPGTDCRVVTVKAPSEDALEEISRQIIAKTAECVEASPSDSLGEHGALKLRTIAPKHAVGGVIGKGGARIKELREQSGAQVSIGEKMELGSGSGAEQIITITGTERALERVMDTINKEVQALNGEPWFMEWADTPGAVNTKGYGKGHHDYDYDGGRGGDRGRGDFYDGGRGEKSHRGETSRSYGGDYAEYGAGRNGHRGGGGYPPMTHSPRGGVATAQPPPGMEILFDVAHQLPPYVTEEGRGFALTCTVPNRLVGGIIGRGGQGIKEVEQTCLGAKVAIREIPGDPENRSLNISGPLGITCAAYMMMMKRYLDTEEEEEERGASGGGGGGGARSKGGRR